jgi:hypothetical protein
MYQTVRGRIRVMMGPALSSLRVVALTYAGLGGVIAMGLLISVAVQPVAPVLVQATDPARQIVSVLALPSTDTAVHFINGGPGFTSRPEKALAVAAEAIPLGPFPNAATGESTNPDRGDVAPDESAPDDADAEQVAAAEPTPAVAPVRVYVARSVAAARVEAPAELDVVEEAAEPEVVPEVTAVPTQPVVVPPVEREVLHVASEASPKPLPPLPTPTESPMQIKARTDAENQAAIDAAKAAQVRAKADADLANQRAISEQKAGAAKH